ncbi:MAG: SAF domain-containing protein [Propionibacteriaceae bacterium]
MTTTTTRPHTEAADQAPPAPPRLRRRPSLVVASALLVVLGALASAWAYSSLGNAQEVVALRTDVARGRVITVENLQVVRVGVDPALRVVPASQASVLVGTRAAVDLKAGQLLVPAAVTSEVLPGVGRSAVGLSLSAAQMPGEPLLVGDDVRIVSTPGAQGDVGVTSPVTYRGQVLTVSEPGADGTTAVTVQVDADAAPEIAARSATGKVALVLDSRVR